MFRSIGKFFATLLVLAGYCQATHWAVDVEAQYQQLFDQQTDRRDPSNSLTANKQVSVEALPFDGFSYALAAASAKAVPQPASNPGMDLDSYAYASGSNPNHGPPHNTLYADATSASDVLWWSLPDANYPVGTDIVVEVTLRSFGVLGASQFGGPNVMADSNASVGLVKTAGPGGGLDYWASADALADPNNGNAPPLLVTPVTNPGGFNPWQGDFFPGPIYFDPIYGALPTWELDEVDVMMFPSRVGDVFNLRFMLDASGDTDGPHEVFTESEVGSRYRLRMLDAATGQVVANGFGATERSADLDQDGDFDCADVDRLVDDIVHNPLASDSDLNQDGVVDANDLGLWLAIAGAYSGSGMPYLPGDANLDGTVDVADFNIWNSNRFTNGQGWCSADFNADGFVDVLDFNVWNSQKFQTRDGLQSVPEPAVQWLAVVASCLVAGYRRGWRKRDGVPSFLG